jgi:hypothetical protein
VATSRPRGNSSESMVEWPAPGGWATGRAASQLPCPASADLPRRAPGLQLLDQPEQVGPLQTQGRRGARPVL